MWTVVLTGGVGCGKSSVARLFTKYPEVQYFSADDAAHQVLATSVMQQKLAQRYGNFILNYSAKEQRTFLAPKLIADLSERRWLESKLHPEVLAQLRAKIASKVPARQYLLAEVPLYLPLASLIPANRVLVVDTLPQHQLHRLHLKRPELNAKQLKDFTKLLDAPERFKEVADDVIDNNGPIVNLAKQVAKLHRYYLTLF